MPEAERRETGAFATLAPFRDGNIFGAKFSGNGAWERHPNGDELVQIVDGETRLHIITDDGPQTHELKGGMLVVGRKAPGIVSSLRTALPDDATPKPTEHLTVDVDDPRTVKRARCRARRREVALICISTGGSGR